MAFRITETRTFIGDDSAREFAGFVIGQRYQLTYEQRPSGTVAVHMVAAQPVMGRVLVVTWEQFERWWVR